MPERTRRSSDRAIAPRPTEPGPKPSLVRRAAPWPAIAGTPCPRPSDLSVGGKSKRSHRVRFAGHGAVRLVDPIQNNIWVERVIREVKEDFLAWLTGQPFPERPTLAWYDAMARRWASEVVATRRHRTTKRIVGEAWAEEHGLLTPVSRRLLARIEGLDTLVPLPEPVGARQKPAVSGETVEVRPLAAYAALVR